jgi:hypothetical protein
MSTTVEKHAISHMCQECQIEMCPGHARCSFIIILKETIEKLTKI